MKQNVAEPKCLWTSTNRYFDLLWLPVLSPLFQPLVIGSNESGSHNMACESASSTLLLFHRPLLAKSRSVFHKVRLLLLGFMEQDLLSTFTVFYVSKKHLYFIKKLPCFLRFLRLFHILLLVPHKFLEANWYFPLKMDSDVQNNCIGCN
jgi:hypothetical protein